MSEKFKVKFRETNHRFDVKFTETMNINADRVLKPITIIQNGVYTADETTAYSPITVAVPEPVIEPLTVTENGTYTAEDCDGYNPVEVEVPDPVIKPFTFTENGVYDIAKELKYGEKCFLKDYIDIDTLLSSLREQGLQKGDTLISNGEERLIYRDGKLKYGLASTTITAIFLETASGAYGYFKQNTLVGNYNGWYKENSSTKIENLSITLPTDESGFKFAETLDNFIFKDSIFEKIDGANPITVDVKPNIQPLTITENGVYTAEDCDGYSPIAVQLEGLVTKAQALKGLVDARKQANQLFQSADMSDEELKEYLKFNVTENAKTFQHMFLYSRLTEIPPFDISKATELNSTFMVCSKLLVLPMLDTAHIVNFNAVINQSASIKIIPSWDVRSGTNFSGAFNSDQSLEEIWWRNIKANLQVGSGSTWGHKLTLESLIRLIKELRDTGEQKTFTVGSTNLAKLANIYVRTIPITDEMRAEDDLIDEKLPFEVCESTDEGAVLISEYVVSKNWQLA